MNGRKKPRQPRWAAISTISLASSRVKPIDDETRAEVNAKRHAALVRFAEGTATSADLTLFDFTAYIGRAVAEAGVGVELLALATEADAVLAAVRQRMADHDLAEVGAIRSEYDVLQELVALVDMQMQSMTLGQYVACQRSAVGALQRAGLFNPEGARA